MKRHQRSTYKKEKHPGTTSFTFIPDKNPSVTSGPVSAILSFVFIGDSLVIIRNKDTQWDIVGGKIDDDETQVESIFREVYEEAGVYIDKKTITQVGYFLCVSSPEVVDRHHPKRSVMPVTISFAHSVDYDWVPRETLSRRLVSLDEAQKLFGGTRDDGGQLADVLLYVRSVLKDRSFKAEFNYKAIEDCNETERSPTITTQCMAVCTYNGKVCIVRDTDEDHYSLVGGGCELGESSIECIHREVEEEAQFSIPNPRLIGRLYVYFSLDGVLVSKISHDRYIGEANGVHEFIPIRNGFEIEERDFVTLAELQEKVKIMQNDTGDAIMIQLKSLDI